MNHSREPWRLAGAITIGLHLMVAVLTFVGINFWSPAQPVTPSYSVKLFSSRDLPASKGPSAPKPAQPKPQPAKPALPPLPPPEPPKPVEEPAKVVKETVPVPPPPPKEQVKPRETPAPPKPEPKEPPKEAVSLKPKPETKPVPPPPPQKSEEALLKERIEKLSQQRSENRKTEEALEKRIASAKERVAERKMDETLEDRIRVMASRVDGKDRSGDAAEGLPGEGPSMGQDQFCRLYPCDELFDRIRRAWVLPEQLLKETGLSCVVVVTIAQDGSLADVQFEKKSGNTMFDLSTMKAVKDAGKLPPVPRALGRGPIEIGLNFRPGEVGI